MANTLPTVTDASFTAEVVESERPVLVDFWAAWCGPCRVMDPLLADIAATRDDVKIVSVDVDVERETAARYGVLSMPTFLLFRDGAPVMRLVGSRPRKRLESELAEAFAQPAGQHVPAW